MQQRATRSGLKPERPAPPAEQGNEPEVSWRESLRERGARPATPEEVEAFLDEHGPLLPADGEG